MLDLYLWIVSKDTTECRRKHLDFKIFPGGGEHAERIYLRHSSWPDLPYSYPGSTPALALVHDVMALNEGHQVTLSFCLLQILWFFQNANAKQHMSRAEINLQSQFYFDHWTQANLMWNPNTCLCALCTCTHTQRVFHAISLDRWLAQGKTSSERTYQRKRAFHTKEIFLLFKRFAGHGRFPYTVQSKLAIKSWHKGGRWNLQLHGQLPKAWSSLRKFIACSQPKGSSTYTIQDNA